MTFECIDDPTRKLLANPRKAESAYIKAAELDQPIPPWLTDHEAALLQPDWVAVRVCFRMSRPWYSRDDIPLHPLYNSVRRDRVTGRPFMAASSWKGLLRWACRMAAGNPSLIEQLAKPEGYRGWQEPKPIVHLFGNDARDQESFARGALAFRPTWFEKGIGGPLIGFELINPHDRAKKAGKNPIIYEVVAAGSKGTLELLYAPSPGQTKRDDIEPRAALTLLLNAVERLLESYGISAKRTAGWGLAKIATVQLRRRGANELCGDTGTVRDGLDAWLAGRRHD